MPLPHPISHIRLEHAQNIFDCASISGVQNLHRIPQRRYRPWPRQPRHRLVRRQPLRQVMLRAELDAFIRDKGHEDDGHLNGCVPVEVKRLAGEIVQPLGGQARFFTHFPQRRRFRSFVWFDATVHDFPGSGAARVRGAAERQDAQAIAHMSEDKDVYDADDEIRHVLTQVADGPRLPVRMSVTPSVAMPSIGR